MLTPREVAASKYLSTRGMSRKVLGHSAEQNEQLRVARVAQLRDALLSLEKAKRTPPILASEWDDDVIEVAVRNLERQIEAESAALAVQP